MQGFSALYLQTNVLQSASEASPAAPCTMTFTLVTRVFVPHYFNVHWCGTWCMKTKHSCPPIPLCRYVLLWGLQPQEESALQLLPVLPSDSSPQGSGLRCCPLTCRPSTALPYMGPGPDRPTGCCRSVMGP